MTTTENKIAAVFFFCLFILGLVIYWGPISAAPTLVLDDGVLSTPMAQVHSVDDYLRLWRDNVIVDVQPLRDLSYVAEFSFERLTGWRDQQFVNLVLWTFAIVGLYRLLGCFIQSRNLRMALVAYAFFHPLAVNSVAWIASRKHLLTALFTVWATAWWVIGIDEKKPRKLWQACGFFLLGCLSQPINVLWPIWAAAYVWLRDRDGVKKRMAALIGPAVTLGIVSLATLLTNMIYYGSARYADHAHSAGGIKYQSETWHGIVERVLTLGRYVYQLVLPTLPSIVPYDLDRPESYVGLIFLPIILFALVKLLPRRTLFVWLLYTALPLAVVLIKRTHHTGWDTYLLTPLFGWTALVGLAAEKINERVSMPNWEMVRRAGLALLAAFFLFETNYAANAWVSNDAMWTRALAHERYHIAVAANAKSALVRKDFPMALTLITELRDRYPKHPELPYLYGRYIFTDPEFSPEQKQSEFAKYNFDGAWFQYYWSALDAMQGHYAEADDRMNRLWTANPKGVLLEFADEIGEVAARWQIMCERAGRTGCDQHPISVQAMLSKSRWPASQYEERIKKMRGGS